MKNSRKPKGAAFSDPATYRLVVMGILKKSWANRLAGMRIADDITAEGSPKTVLIGRVRDQAELMGVLNALYELHMPLLQVKQLDEE
jgi:hypothetical protein